MMTNNYRINLYTIETTDGEKWCAEYPELPGCVGGGDTPNDALKEAEENKKVYLEFLEEEGEPLPKKTEEKDYNGKISFRTTKTNHKLLLEIAEKEGVSLNHLLNDYVSKGIDNYSSSKAITEIIQDKIETLDRNVSGDKEVFDYFSYKKEEMKNYDPRTTILTKTYN